MGALMLHPSYGLPTLAKGAGGISVWTLIDVHWFLELADHDPSVPYRVWNTNFNAVFIQPQLLCRLKINAVFRLV